MIAKREAVLEKLITNCAETTTVAFSDPQIIYLFINNELYPIPNL